MKTVVFKIPDAQKRLYDDLFLFLKSREFCLTKRDFFCYVVNFLYNNKDNLPLLNQIFGKKTS